MKMLKIKEPSKFHRLLKRQIKKATSNDGVLDIEILLPLVSLAYDDYDQSKALNEHAMQFVSKEMNDQNDELLKSKVFLENQTSELEEFAYRTSHDLRSPLVSSIALLEFAEKALQKGENSNVEKSIILAQDSLKKLETLVRDILSLTQTKNAEEELQDTYFTEIVESALSKFKNMDNFERLSIETNIKYHEKFQCKKSRLVLIVENLLTNAIKYQDLEKEDSFIKIIAYSKHDEIYFLVEDNGIGIPQEHHHKLFSMFQRFHSSTSFGSGLGLYMIKKSAEILKGDIMYDETSNGSVFKLVIPNL